MNEFRKRNIVSICERTLEASNWTKFDQSYVVDNNYVICFKTTAKSEDKRSIVRSIIDSINRQEERSGKINQSGIVVFENRKDPSDTSIVGVVEANISKLDQQYRRIREILKSFGLADGHARKLFYDDAPAIKLTKTETTTKSRGIKLGVSAKIDTDSDETIALPVQASAEAEFSYERASSVEDKLQREDEVSFGAVRSALLINMISNDIGVRDLEKINNVEPILKGLERMEKEEALLKISREIEYCDRDLTITADAVIHTIHDQLYGIVKNKDSRGLYDEMESTRASIVMNNLRLAAKDIAKGVVSSGTFDLLLESEEILVGSLNQEYMSNAIDYCTHGIMLFGSLLHARNSCLKAKERVMERNSGNEEDFGLVSSSLGFFLHRGDKMESPQADVRQVRRCHH